MIIVIDFDDTCVEHKYPIIGNNIDADPLIGNNIDVDPLIGNNIDVDPLIGNNIDINPEWVRLRR